MLSASCQNASGSRELSSKWHLLYCVSLLQITCNDIADDVSFAASSSLAMISRMMCPSLRRQITCNDIADDVSFAAYSDHLQRYRG